MKSLNRQERLDWLILLTRQSLAVYRSRFLGFLVHYRVIRSLKYELKAYESGKFLHEKEL